MPRPGATDNRFQVGVSETGHYRNRFNAIGPPQLPDVGNGGFDNFPFQGEFLCKFVNGKLAPVCHDLFDLFYRGQLFVVQLAQNCHHL